MENKIKNVAKLMVFLALGIFCFSFVSAYGVTPLYGDERPLALFPGESRTVPFILQNMVGEQDVKFRAELISGSEIAVLVDGDMSEHSVPIGRDDVEVSVRINIPEGEAIGNEYSIGVSFTQIPSDDAEMVQLAGTIQSSFPVIIGEELPGDINGGESGNLWLWVVGIIIVLIIIYFVVKKKN